MKRADASEPVHAELIACERAIATGQFRAAERHLQTASKLGASREIVTRHGQAINKARQSRSQRSRKAAWWGFAAAIVGYLVLSCQQPAGWGEGLWAGLAFVLVPAIAAFVVNRAQGRSCPSAQAFFTGMKAAGWAMFFYASVTLVVLARRVGGSANGAQELLAGLLVTVVYTLVAGAAAGFVNLIFTRTGAGRGMVNAGETGAVGSAPTRGEDEHGPAS